MIFFVRQVEYYCHLEVVACQWKELEDFVAKKDGDLDKLIDAHHRYITTLVEKALLKASGRRKKEVKPLIDQLRDIFKVMLQHKNVAVSKGIGYPGSEAPPLRLRPRAGRSLRVRDAVRVVCADHADEQSSEHVPGALRPFLQQLIPRPASRVYRRWPHSRRRLNNWRASRIVSLSMAVSSASKRRISSRVSSVPPTSTCASLRCGSTSTISSARTRQAPSRRHRCCEL